MVDRGEVCVLLPTYDEAATIGDVIAAFSDRGFSNVLVVDGHSTDGTREIAREHGARVLTQSGHGRGAGKGQAVREGVARADAPYVLLLDGDGTYRPEDADALLEPLLSGEAEHVIGDRYADMADGAMTRLNGVGNRLINRAFQYIHGRDLGDILSGYRAFTTASFERCNPSSEGFGIETELAVECVKRGIPTTVVPIRYRARPDGSETNLRPVRDGGKILLTLYRLAKTNNPLFYFGSAGGLAGLVGAVVAAYVAIEWITLGISHEVLAVASAFAIIVGVQLVMFGVLSDMILAINREQTRRFEELVGRRRADRPPSSAPRTQSRSGDYTDPDTESSADRPLVSERGEPRDDRRRSRHARNDGGESEAVEPETDGERPSG
ncbi:S-layer glycoprotein N-glycosyltransferase AglJ [Halococcus saccharolyticus]|uniref:Family 2 glycosyl transferase n=1 Tax=Halococcus saccharolyticus DSM 5350 TaxID=1227455 RepID=M0MKZ8_9EURY|nr:S-layer glycoprotein N-glycosyltransferase AglJ [Halococcus saccharolyticus]EMA45105.1 family 2 glycosyl transferase [Halococcus saccharolyticus DSM 5350]